MQSPLEILEKQDSLSDIVHRLGVVHTVYTLHSARLTYICIKSGIIAEASVVEGKIYNIQISLLYKALHGLTLKSHLTSKCWLLGWWVCLLVGWMVG